MKHSWIRRFLSLGLTALMLLAGIPTPRAMAQGEFEFGGQVRGVWRYETTLLDLHYVITLTLGSDGNAQCVHQLGSKTVSSSGTYQVYKEFLIFDGIDLYDHIDYENGSPTLSDTSEEWIFDYTEDNLWYFDYRMENGNLMILRFSGNFGADSGDITLAYDTFAPVSGQTAYADASQAAAPTLERDTPNTAPDTLSMTYDEPDLGDESAENTYLVKFVDELALSTPKNRGKNPDSAIVSQGETLFLADYDPFESDYTLTGWHVQGDEKRTFSPNGALIIDKDIVLVADWAFDCPSITQSSKSYLALASLQDPSTEATQLELSSAAKAAHLLVASSFDWQIDKVPTGYDISPLKGKKNTTTLVTIRANGAAVGGTRMNLTFKASGWAGFLQWRKLEKSVTLNYTDTWLESRADDPSFPEISDQFKPGNVIRFISQHTANKEYFNPELWPSRFKNGANSGCTLCATCMALTSLGIDVIPKDLIGVEYDDKVLVRESDTYITSLDNLSQFISANYGVALKYDKIQARQDSFDTALEKDADNKKLLKAAIDDYRNDPAHYSPPIVRVFSDPSHSVLVVDYNEEEDSYSILDTSYYMTSKLYLDAETLEQANPKINKVQKSKVRHSRIQGIYRFTVEGGTPAAEMQQAAPEAENSLTSAAQGGMSGAELEDMAKQYRQEADKLMETELGWRYQDGYQLKRWRFLDSEPLNGERGIVFHYEAWMEYPYMIDNGLFDVVYYYAGDNRLPSVRKEYTPNINWFLNGTWRCVIDHPSQSMIDYTLFADLYMRIDWFEGMTWTGALDYTETEYNSITSTYEGIREVEYVDDRSGYSHKMTLSSDGSTNFAYILFSQTKGLVLQTDYGTTAVADCIEPVSGKERLERPDWIQ